MAYTNPLQVAQVSGLGVRIIDEQVGTGDNSEKDFDLDEDNIVAGSYVISYQDATDDNVFTAMTETTHYSLDKESGRILLTSAGVTILGTKKMYATYFYTDSLGPDLLDQWIIWGDAEVNLDTKRNWGTPEAFNEYFDGRKVKPYPRTDRPYSADWDSPPFILLDKTPITGINYVYFLSNNALISKLWNYDDNLAIYSDNTKEANTAEGTAFSAFASTPAANDIIYIGCGYKFTKMQLIFATVATGSPNFTWEYYNGTAWASFTPVDNTSSFTMNGTFTFTMPANWQKVSVNSSDSLYFIRASIDGTFTTPPSVYNIVLKDVVTEAVSLTAVEWEDWGKLSFIGVSVPNGTRNVLINYNHGYTSTPDLVQELAAIYVSIRSFVYITGGSFDDVTSATLGSKSVGIGEPYINMREALNMLKARRKELLRLVGARYDIELTAE